ncbi:MAG: uroporphyrinogen decarboxylase family protein [Planctomycetota bacterium]
MDNRERVIATLTFQKPDRIPLEPGRGRKSTRETWRAQGLPAEVKDADIHEYAYWKAGGKFPWPRGGPGIRMVDRMIPEFEEKVIERKGTSQIVQDWKGNVCEIGSEFTLEHLRSAIDFVTRRWIKCPVETRADWADMKRRYNPDDPARFSADIPGLKWKLAGRDGFVSVSLSGPFWQLREWLGFERLCEMFLDGPDFVREMLAFWSDFGAKLLENTFRDAVPDMLHISEDMAYKGFPMISPAMSREFLLPVWRRWGDICRKAGVPLYAVDSDGYTADLISIWIDAGINVCDPMEVAAGIDLPALRKRFGRNMAFRGGVDKRAMAKGGDAIVTEILRLSPVIRDGGYIPGCDHGVPPDVSWPDFVRYTGLLAKETGWL